jgi:hypothetical protein
MGAISHRPIKFVFCVALKLPASLAYILYLIASNTCSGGGYRTAIAFTDANSHILVKD